MAQAFGSQDLSLDKKRTIISLQLLIMIVSSYLMLFSKGRITEDPWVYTLVLIFLVSVLFLYRFPENAFYHPRFDLAFLVFDTTLISAAIYMNRDVSWDLFLFYFFILFLAAIGQNMLRIVLGSILISLIYLGLLIQQGKDLTQIGADLFIRIPFLFGASILYGYLAESARKEKLRAEAAEQKERLKMDLVSALAHDIKNPLGTIMGYAETMMDQFADRNDGKFAVEILERIQASGTRIVNLVTGFLEASKAEVGKLEIANRPVSVNALLKEVSRQQESDMERKQLTLELKLADKLPEVLGDEAQLDRVFWNLVGNAIKFTPMGGKITVSSKRDDGYVCVIVEDTGIGISDEDVPLLFSKFRRLKGASRIEGTGLGLFIVKTIIEAHKGTVQVKSVHGQGSVFTIRLPIRFKPLKS